MVTKARNQDLEFEIKQFTRNEFLSLGNHRADYCLTIYLPMIEEESNRYEENRIRFKNAMQRAAKKMEKKGVTSPEIDRFLEEPRRLIDDDHFWAHQKKGLVIFVAPDFVRFVRLNAAPVEDLYLLKRFIMRPALAELVDNQTAYLLALSQNEVKLYKIYREAIKEMHLDEMPTSMADTLAYDDPEKRLFSRSATQSADRGAIYHGHTPKDNRKSDLERFCRHIANGLQKEVFKNDQNKLLLLAGTQEIVAVFREIADFSAELLNEEITGNVESLPTSDLHARSWPIVDDYFQSRRMEHAKRYKALTNDGLTVATTAEVVRAAHFGQIECLFVSTTVTVFGTFDEQTAEVNVAGGKSDPKQIELLDLATLKTLENGGMIIPLYGQADPPAAAILRFSIEPKDD